MERSSSPGNSFEETAASEAGKPDAPPIVGDADAVQKTTYVVGRGTDPSANQPVDEAAPGRTPSGADPLPASRRGTDDLDH